MKPKAPDLYYVEWVDACTSHGWTDLDDVAKTNLARCKSVGWLTNETPEAITLISSTHDGGDGGVAFQVDGHIMIPASSVTRRVKLKVGK